MERAPLRGGRALRSDDGEEMGAIPTMVEEDEDDFVYGSILDAAQKEVLDVSDIHRLQRAKRKPRHRYKR